MGQLPSLIIIGAMKAGTTSLYNYLSSHPDIGASRKKEINFFLGKGGFRKGINWYKSFFNNDLKVNFEASTNYSKRHLWSDVPKRIFHAIPDVKLIYIVRDPIKRAVSHYIHNKAYGREKNSINNAIVHNSNYIKTSMYYFQIMAYLEYFNLEQIHIIDSDDLNNRTSLVLRDTFSFLGINDSVEIKNMHMKYHLSKNKKHISILDKYIKSNKAKKIIHPYLPSFLSDKKEIITPSIDEERKNQLINFLKEDINSFRRLTGKLFSSWEV